VTASPRRAAFPPAVTGAGAHSYSSAPPTAWRGAQPVQRANYSRWPTLGHQSGHPRDECFGLGYELGSGIDAIRERITFLADLLRARLGELSGVAVLDRGGTERSGIVGDDRNEDLVRALAAQAINVRLMPMTVLARYDHDMRGLTTLIRVSVHYFSDEAEIDRLAAAAREQLRLG
jgi:hypothetical protein